MEEFILPEGQSKRAQQTIKSFGRSIKPVGDKNRQIRHTEEQILI